MRLESVSEVKMPMIRWHDSHRLVDITKKVSVGKEMAIKDWKLRHPDFSDQVHEEEPAKKTE